MIRIAMLGRSEGNGHPYSWSAIINGGYDEEMMKVCPFPVIYEYLSKQPKENLGITGAKVTHIWAEDKEEAQRIAKTSLIENVVDDPEDLIGKVDAVIIAEDVGSRHLCLALPFIKRDIPIFIDKPLTDNEEDLKAFISFFRERKPILSSSSYRYAKEIENLDREEVGKILFVDGLINKSWEKYGVHCIEGLCQLMGYGIEEVYNLGDEKVNIVYLRYNDKRQAIVNVIYPAQISRYDIIGEKATKTILISDSFYMFKRQLQTFVDFVRTGKFPYPPEETIEITKVIIAGIRSREKEEPIKIRDILN
jgi:predicted dehydrogenase